VKPNGSNRPTSSYEKQLLKVTGNPPTIDTAVGLLVSELLQDVSTVPTDLDALGARLDILEFRAENLPFSGELRRNGKGLEIVYSIHLEDDRRRFTIAHELGHALLERAGKSLPHSGTEVERLCDKFAAEILMPKDIFLGRLGPTLTIERLFDLKRAFKVSLSAVAFRCFELRRVSVFEVDNECIRWGSGIVRKGPLHLIESGIRLCVTKAVESERGNEEVYFNDNGNTWRGELEWLRRSLGRTLFILRRNNKPLTVTAPIS
jgi:hypothetical protein